MTRLQWSKIESRQFEAGVDRGVLYRNDIKYYSNTAWDLDALNPGTTVINTPLTSPYIDQFVPGEKIYMRDRATGLNQIIEGTVVNINISPPAVMLEVDAKTGTGVNSDWVVTQPKPAVPWNGLTGISETGGESAVSYYVDGRPFLYFPKPKEFTATITAYTYPEEFSSNLGIIEAVGADGMYLDSQVGDSFGLSYRTLIGNVVEGEDFAYKIHLVYNATVVPSAINYDTVGASINPVEFSWAIQAVPLQVAGYRATAHVIIDTRHIDEDKLAQIEALLYGDDTTTASLPNPQDVFDVLSYGDAIIITDLGDGTWEAQGSYTNIYMIADGVFKIDNVNAVDNGDGTYDISSTP